MGQETFKPSPESLENTDKTDQDQTKPSQQKSEDFSGARFLKEKYNLHTAPEVERAVRRKKAQGTQIENKPLPRVQVYLDRLSKALNPQELENHDGFDRRERNLRMLKSALHKNSVIKPEDIPESYWQERKISAPEQKEKEAETIAEDQVASLDLWADYLASDEIDYPLWLRYYALRGALGMGSYEKENLAFSKRDKSTVAPFPDLNSEALAIVLEAVEKRQSSEWKNTDQEIRRISNEQKRFGGEARKLEKENKTSEAASVKLKAEEAQRNIADLVERQEQLLRSVYPFPHGNQNELTGLLEESNFDQLYSWTLGDLAKKQETNLQVTDGEWVLYSQDSDPTILVQSLRGRDTGWSTVGESTAKKYLSQGDMHVFYSLDASGKPTIPRVSIKMKGGAIQQVRGIAGGQNLDTYITNVAKEKLHGFDDGESLEKRLLDTDRLGHIEHKIKTQETLDSDELRFLYEIDSPIEGFGYQRDPRIRELRNTRDKKADALVVFNCEEGQIARNLQDIREGTQVYIGPLVKGIFEKTEEAGVKYLYTEFPEHRVELDSLVTGGKSKQELEQELRQEGIKISIPAEQMLRNPEFITSNDSETINTVLLDVADFGFKEEPNIDQILARARELGLDRCSGEVGIYRRLKDRNQPSGSWYIISMKRIDAGDGDGRVFRLLRTGSKIQLHDYWSHPTDSYSLSTRILFQSTNKPTITKTR